MANPNAYHTMMYEFFHKGEMPEVETDDKGEVTKTRKRPPKAAVKEFEDLLKIQQDPERIAKRKAALQAKIEREAAERERAAAAE